MKPLYVKLQERAESPEDYEAQVRARYEAKKASLVNLAGNKDFKAYLTIEAEMNDPKIVIAHDCSDPVCMSLKRKIRDFWKRQRLLEKLQEESVNGKVRK
jgi:hypothetical protein